MEPIYDTPVSLSDVVAMSDHPDVDPAAIVVFRTVRQGAGKRAEYAITRSRRFARGWKRMGPVAEFSVGQR